MSTPEITPELLGAILFELHTHAELVFYENPDQIVYKEEDIVFLLERLGHPRPVFGKTLKDFE